MDAENIGSPSNNKEPTDKQAKEIINNKISQENPASPDSSLIQPKPNPLGRCLMMIKKARSDTEKFASLLMVTKIVKAEELAPEERKQLIDAIGLPFLCRMIKSNEAPDGCPPFMYKSIAITILTCFASCCHGSSTLYSVIPDLTEVVSNPDSYEENIVIVKESYECLNIIASEKPGRLAIINFEGVSALVETYKQQSYGFEQALAILRLIMMDCGSKTWENEPEAFNVLAHSVLTDFSTEDDEQVFTYCDIIIDILHSIPDACERDDSSWKLLLHKGICNITFSKLNKEHRIKGLQLAGAALDSLGISWIVNTGEKGRQLFLMMVHLACIEVRMALEEKSFAQAVSLAFPTTACYSIIEYAIKFLINGAIDLEEKQKQQLYAALKGAFTAVLLFLKEVFSDQVHTNDYKIQIFICATIRVLSAWLAEETSANKEEVYEILPFLIKTAQYNFEWNLKLNKSKKKSGKSVQTKHEDKVKLPDLLVFLLPGLCHFSAEDIPRYILLELNIEKLLYNYLSFHWDSVKKGFSTEENSNEEIDENEAKVPVDSFVTICNVYMNIVIQEPERVRTDSLYSDLLKFIFSNAPNIPDNENYLQLCGSLSVLGLMILRHQHHNVKNSYFNIFRFIQTTVRFLWDAHNVEESQDYATLVVSSKYSSIWDDLMELWFLGMHTLTVLLPSISWLCDFLVESEWPHVIINTLISVREKGLEDGVKSAFEDFLCTLVQSDQKSLKALKDEGILTLCINHKMEDLQKIIKEKDSCLVNPS